jgi:hypothetical protein
MKAFLSLALAILVAAPASALPVFPGAVGYGTDTKAGRDAANDADHIYKVTRLDDPDYTDPPVGTLRYGIEKVSGPRVIVFERSGVIELRRDLMVRPTTTVNNVVRDQGFLTIAGQTAPFPGITLKNGGIRIYSHDVLIQHIAIRPGTFTKGDEHLPDNQQIPDGWDLSPIDNRDCIGPGGTSANNIVIDHVTCSWTTDEMATTWWNASTNSGTVSNITFSNNIFAYPIWSAGHSDGVNHGLGVLIGPGSSNVTIVRNVMAFADNRNPLIRHQTAGAQVVNNFVFRPGMNRNSVIYVGKKHESQPATVGPFFETRVSAIGNYAELMRARNGASAHQEGFYVSQQANLDLFLYLNGNYTYQPDAPGLSAFQPTSSATSAQYSQPYYSHNPANPTDPNNGRMTPTSHRLTSDPYANSGTTWRPILGPPAHLKWKIVPGAGKFPAQRDFYDADLMRKIHDPDDDSSWLMTESELNGGNDPWAPVNIQNERPFNVANPTGDDDADGYTNLEEELHRLAAIVEGRSSAVPTDPANSKFDTFTDANSNGWTTAITGASGSWAVSGNALVQSAVDQDSRATLNGSNWTDQVVEARVDASQFNGTSFVAVYARFKNPGESYYLTLRSTGAAELKRIKDGVVTPYATKPVGTYDPLAPHVLRLEVVGNSLRGYIDNTLALSGTDNEWGINSGKAGVGSYHASSSFDDVFASPFPPGSRVTDDFDDQNANGWSMAETGAGSWSAVPFASGSSNYVMRQSQTTLNHRAVRAVSSRDQATQARVRLGTASDPNGFVAVYARYQDASNAYYALLRSSRTLELKKIIGGSATQTIATYTLPASFDLTVWHTLRIEVSGGKLTTLRAYLDGQLQLVGSDVDSPFFSGSAAFGTYAASADFDELVLSQP